MNLLQKTRVSSLIASLFLGVSTVAVTSVLPESAAAQISGRFSAILVSGNQSNPDQTVASLSGLDLSQSLTPADINAAVRRLIASGLFSDVDIRAAAGRLVVAVVENPIIAVVNFEGNKGIKDADLAAIVTSASRRPLDRPTIEADARRIAAVYQQRSRYSATVTPLVIPLADGRSNLVFQITEGRTEQIESVNFVGNQSFTDRRLRRTVASSESGLLNFLYNSDNFSPERAAADQQALLSFYRDRGYPDVEVTSGLSEFALDRDGFFLTYSIREGAAYNFGNASVSTNLSGVDIADFERLVRLRSGRTYSGSKVEKVIEAIEEEATRLGLPFLRAIPRITKNEADGSVDINFELVSGNRVYVERIDIRGNSQTLDRVIRREFDMAEGDAFNPRKVRQAENALRALRFFSQLQVSSRQGSTPESVILDVQVADQATGSFNFGASYSTDAGVSGTFSISETNFLGRGQRFDLSLSYGESSKVASFGFTEPQFLGRDLAASFDIFYRDNDREESSFLITSFGVSPSISFPLSERTRASFTYELESEEIRDTIPGTTSPIIIAEEGTSVRSAVRFNLSHDRRNSGFDPSSGYVLRLGAEYAGLGGDANYTKATARAKGYFNLFDEALIFSADLEGGALFSNGGSESRVTDRFFLGGNSFRGFDVGGLGPRDNNGTVNDSLGGNYYAVARLDANFPIGLPQELGIRGGLFIDAGSVWGMDGAPVGASGPIDATAQLRAAAGFALYWETPIGPLVFNWANPFLTVDGDETQSFNVSVKTAF